MQAITFFSSLISHCRGSAFPPRLSIYWAAEYIVPGNVGFYVTVLAKIATFAPSLAHAFAIANPIPREPPVTTIVFPLNGLSLFYEIWLLIQLSLFIYLIKILWCHYDIFFEYIIISKNPDNLLSLIKINIAG